MLHGTTVTFKTPRLSYNTSHFKTFTLRTAVAIKKMYTYDSALQILPTFTILLFGDVSSVSISQDLKPPKQQRCEDLKIQSTQNQEFGAEYSPRSPFPAAWTSRPKHGYIRVIILFYLIFAKNKLLVLSKAQPLALRPTEPHQTKCTGNSIAGMSPLEHSIPKSRICEPVPQLPHTPSQGVMYGRIILFCKNTTSRKRKFSSPITVDTLNFMNSWL
jgi:hypothetical protein